MARGREASAAPCTCQHVSFDRMPLKTPERLFQAAGQKKQETPRRQSIYAQRDGQWTVEAVGPQWGKARSTPQSDQLEKGELFARARSMRRAPTGRRAPRRTRPQGLPHVCRGRLRFLATLTNGRSAARGPPHLPDLRRHQTTPGGSPPSHAGTHQRTPRARIQEEKGAPECRELSA